MFVTDAVNHFTGIHFCSPLPGSMVESSIQKEVTKEFRQRWIDFIHTLQDTICKAIEAVDGKAKFAEDEWQRAEGKGGGGLTKVIQNGNVFEKGGVNTSVVYGHLTESMCKILQIDFLGNDATWFAAGISSVVHPLNPFVPAVHFNYRLFELYDGKGMLANRWFGGGTDLTPCYLFEEDAKHFHQTYKNVCDQFNKNFYQAFKKNCDDYFVNTHRGNERRGVGGIFYDHQKADELHNADFWMNFAKACGYAFQDAYLPIAEKRKNTIYNSEHKRWQEIRRGRYVEFNLIHDRGTLFGLKTNGRTESILMSLPSTVRFEYNYKPQAGSEEDQLLQVCLRPGEWV